MSFKPIGMATFWAIISLNLTLKLIQDYNVVAATLPITGASVTTPIVVTSPAHGIPLGRLVHGIVSGVTGTTEANGLWILTPQDADTLTLSTFSPQGIVIDSVGVHAYAGGGQFQYALPDGQILLGARNKATATATSSPRFVVVPTDARAWTFDVYGASGPDDNVRGDTEQQSAKTQPQLATEIAAFQVFVTGSGPNYSLPLSPDFYDFEATQALYHALYEVLFDAALPMAKVLRSAWPSQKDDQGGMTQRGQQWMGIIELQFPVVNPPLSFVPIGVQGQFTVEPANPASGDATIITFSGDAAP